jgi:argininosuccinate lyase
MTINRFATDMLIFTTSEYGYFSVSETVCSGSSIMPQKKNLDLAELLRSKIHVSLGYYQQLTGVATSLPSGYNRDIQDTKKPLIESLELTNDCIKVTSLLLLNITPNEDKMRAALTNEIFATHQALENVTRGASFREAYRDAGKLEYKFDGDIDEILKKSAHVGGTGNLGLEKIDSQISALSKRQGKDESKFQEAVNTLTKGEK